MHPTKDVFNCSFSLRYSTKYSEMLVIFLLHHVLNLTVFAKNIMKSLLRICWSPSRIILLEFFGVWELFIFYIYPHSKSCGLCRFTDIPIIGFPPQRTTQVASVLCTQRHGHLQMALFTSSTTNRFHLNDSHNYLIPNNRYGYYCILICVCVCVCMCTLKRWFSDIIYDVFICRTEATIRQFQPSMMSCWIIQSTRSLLERNHLLMQMVMAFVESAT